MVSKTVDAIVPFTMKIAFALKEGMVIAANGKAMTESDLWKRIEAGNPVVILSPQVREFEDLDQPVRARFKENTILLVGSTRPLKDSLKKPW